MRAYRPGDEAALTVLFARVFGKPLTEDEWRWKLKTRSTTAENVFLATYEDAPVFQYAAMPVEFDTPFGTHPVMVSVDTMTAPEFRKRGLLTRFGKSVYDRWASDDIAFAIGIGNRAWGSRYQVFGWQCLFQLRCLIRPIGVESLLRRRSENAAMFAPSLSLLHRAAFDLATPRDAGVEIDIVDGADASFDALWRSVRSQRPVSIVKDASWVNWRFFGPWLARYRVLAAHRRGALVGYAAYRRPSDGIACLAELVARDPCAAGELVRRTVQLAKDDGAEKIQALAVEGSSMSRFLRRTGFWYAPEAHALDVRVLPLRADRAPVWHLGRHHWHLMGADFDTH